MQRRRVFRLLARTASPGRWLLAVVAAGVVVSGLAAARPAVSPPACFGAAARDAAHPCSNPQLRLSVVPSPSEAVLVPNAPCTVVEPIVNACAFGAPSPGATATIGLVGNSHAGHWRAALAVVALALGWHGVSVTRSSCPFMEATVQLPEPGQAQCARWTHGIPGWFEQHPEVATVFVTDQPTPPVVPAGHSQLAVQVGAYIAAWEALPASVRHIVVIRDNPYTHGNVLSCVEEAIARREPAGPKCAVPRNIALKTDPEVIAAGQLRSPRVQVIDMTHFFCDSRSCPAVIGGSLVYRDSTHLTRVFAATLGPFLLEEIRKLMAGWGEG